MPEFPRPMPGDEITPEHFQVLYDALDEGPTVTSPLFKTANGAIALDEKPGFWIQITGAPSGGKYPWKEVKAKPGGTWVDGVSTGSTGQDPAYEINGLTSAITNKYVRAWRDITSFEVRFAYSVCS